MRAGLPMSEIREMKPSEIQISRHLLSYMNRESQGGEPDA